MRLTDEQNIAFMNDPRCLAAQREVDEIKRRIVEDVNCNHATMYYLTVLPPLLKKLEKAFENLNIVETTVQYEILNKEDK